MIKKHIALWILVYLLSGSCTDFLAEKPRSNLAVPTTVKDFQALLDHVQTMNQADGNAAEISADDYFMLLDDWKAQAEDGRRMYLWDHSHVFGETPNDWSDLYRTVYRANTVLEGVEAYGADNERHYWDDLQGQALFHRGRSFFQVANIWCEAYDGAESEALGIPLRLGTDFNERSVRSSLVATYQQILTDLKAASSLLPASSVHVYRPDKAAALGLLARVHLAMRDYPAALRYADSCLQIKDELLDYNTLTTNRPVIPEFNQEIIFYSHMKASRFLRTPWSKVSETLLTLYDEHDLRRSVFFTPVTSSGQQYFTFRGNYNSGNLPLFSGITTAEMVLIRAECHARSGNSTAALADLNTLLSHRIQAATFEALTISDGHDLLQYILMERRKELVFRGLRWMDIKRLNREGAGITLERNIAGYPARLTPNSKRFALPIPEDVIILSGMTQNTYD